MILPRFARVLALVLGLAVLASQSAYAQFAANRAVQRAIDVNTRNALQRVQLTMKVKGSAGKVVVQRTSRNGRYLLLVFEDNRPRVWDLETSRYWDHFESLASPVAAAAIGGDMSFVTIDREGRLARWSKNSGAPVVVAPTGLADPVFADIARTGEALIVARDGTLHSYSENGLQRLGQAVANLTAVRTPMAMDPSGDIVATALGQTGLGLWSSRSGTPVAKVDGVPGISAFTFGEESRQLLIATGNRVLDWDVGAGRATGEFLCAAECRIDKLLVNSATRSLIAVTDAGALLRWSLDDYRAVATVATRGTAPGSVTTAAGAPLLIGGTPRGFVQFSHLERPETSLTLISTNRGWAMIDPLGRFDGQAGQDIGVSWANDEFDLPLPNFVDTHYEPGLFSKWLGAGGAYQTNPAALAEGVLLPPMIAMTITAVDPKSSRPMIDVQVKVTDSGGGLGEPSLYHLGLKVSRDRVLGQSTHREDGKEVAVTTWRVRALPGENTFTAKVRDLEGVVSPARVDSVAIDGRSGVPALHLLAIAVDDYGDENLNLNYSVADAEAVVRQLKERATPVFSRVHSTVIKNEAATREGVLTALRKLQAANPEDVIIIYAASHGDVVDDQFHLLLQGLQLPLSQRRLKRVAIPFDELARELEVLDARRVVMLLDTCKSGDALADLQSEFRDRRALQSFGNLLGVHLIAATAKGQLATESSLLGHGVFTYSIVEGLRGNADRAPTDGRVTASELAAYTAAGVPALSATYASFPQWPTIYARGFDFGVAARAASSGR